jgi:hypothetical protein
VDRPFTGVFFGKRIWPDYNRPLIGPAAKFIR